MAGGRRVNCLFKQLDELSFPKFAVVKLEKLSVQDTEIAKMRNAIFPACTRSF